MLFQCSLRENIIEDVHVRKKKTKNIYVYKKKETYNTKKYYAYLGEIKRTKMKGTSLEKNKCLLKRMSE